MPRATGYTDPMDRRRHLEKNAAARGSPPGSLFEYYSDREAMDTVPERLRKTKALRGPVTSGTIDFSGLRKAIRKKAQGD